MAELADLRLSRPVRPKLNATDKKIQQIIKDIESIKFYRAKNKRNPTKVLKICEKLIYYIVQCIEKSRSDHLLQTTSIWALTTIFRMYPAEVKDIMLVIGMPRILYDILSANILQGSTREYASELCFFLSTDKPDYMYKTVAGERKTIFEGVVGPLPSLPEIARSQKFDNIKKVLRTDKYVHHVDALDYGEDQASTDSFSIAGLGAASPQRAVASKAPAIAEGKSEHRDDDSDSDEDESIFSDVSTNIFDKFTNNSFIPFRLDEHNIAKIDALFQGKKETDLMKLPSLNFLSNFGFESAADEQDERASAGEDTKHDHESIASSMSSDSKSRTFSILTNYDLGTASYSGIHEFSKTAPAMLGKRFEEGNNDNLLKKVVPKAPLQTNFAIQTASASAYAANSGVRGERMVATAPSMQPNVHYREVHRAATAQGSSTGKLFQIGSSSPRAPSTEQANQQLLTYDEPIKEEAENSNPLKSSSFGFDVPPPSSPSVIYSELERLQEKLRVEDAKAKKQSESITDFLDALDPLALSGLNNVNRNVSFQSATVVRNTIPEGEEDFDEDDSQVPGDDETKTMVDSNGMEVNETNPFIARKLERIRAEKLVDHTFMRKLLSKKISISETQSLLERIESILKLMDKDDSGFVTWESFARILLAVAPPKLLREDVIEFMQAQTDSDQNLVDYREFIISGKVMIVDRSRQASGDQPKLYVKGWLERQKQFSGETSTLTWKAHVKWYQQRKANAIVWLMRRAARAIHQTIRLEEADKFLRVLGKRAKVLSELLEIGAKVVVTGAKRMDAKRNMLLRSMRARKQMTVMDESFRFLKTVAAAAWKQLDTIARLKAEEAERKRIEEFIGADGKRPVTVGGGKAKQADIGLVYKVDKLRNMSITFLLTRAKSALVHTKKQLIAFQECKAIAEKSSAHTERQSKTFFSLKSTAVKAGNWCSWKDRVLASLVTIGQNYHKYLERREEATTFLLAMGKNVVRAGLRQRIAAEELRKIGQGKLKWLNGQADAVAYLTRRNVLANRLFVRQREAIAFLKLQSRGIFENAINLQKAQHWLQEIGKRSLQHMKNKQAAIVKLQFVAKRATFLVRRSTIAVTDLTQIGQQARFKRFEFQCRSEPNRMQQMKQEKQALQLSDKEHHRQRITLPIAERWRAELFDAFEYIAGGLSPPVIYDRQEIREGRLGNQKLLIGRILFRKIILFGKIFGAKEEVAALDEYFKTMDPLCLCLIPFESLWMWFLRHAEIREKYLQVHKKKSFTFTLNDILPVEERAFLILYKRYGNEVDPQLGSIPSRVVSSSSPTRSYNAKEQGKMQRTRRKGGFEGIDDNGDTSPQRRGGNDSNSDSDDESFGNAEVEVDHYGDKDIGKLMRYLTRRDLARKEKEEREKAEQEQKEKEEREKAAFVADLLKGALPVEETAAGAESVDQGEKSGGEAGTGDVAPIATPAALGNEDKPAKGKSID